MNAPVAPRRPSRLKLAFWLLLVPATLIALYFFAALAWNYSSGERAGWVQKFSKKGWICKTWEGELAMVSMPGATPEKFHFTVWDEKVASQINAAMGRRVSLHYEEKVGLPTACFGDTRYWVNGVTIVPDIPLAPGISVPAPGASPPTQPPTSPPAAAAPASTPTPLPGATPQTSPSSVTPAPGGASPSTPPPAQPPVPPAK